MSRGIGHLRQMHESKSLLTSVTMFDTRALHLAGDELVVAGVSSLSSMAVVIFVFSLHREDFAGLKINLMLSTQIMQYKC